LVHNPLTIEKRNKKTLKMHNREKRKKTTYDEAKTKKSVEK